MKGRVQQKLEDWKKEQHENYYFKIKKSIEDIRGTDHKIFPVSGWGVNYIICKFRASFSWDRDGNKQPIPSYDIKGCFDICILDSDSSLNFPFPLHSFSRATYQSSIIRSCPLTIFFRSGAKDYFWRPRATPYQASYLENREMMVTVPQGELKPF